MALAELAVAQLAAAVEHRGEGQAALVVAELAFSAASVFVTSPGCATAM